MKKSFTLIELLVVIGLISLVSGSVIGVYLGGIRTQRKILETQEVLSEINYALEYMGRAIRMAKKDDILIGGNPANCCVASKVNYCQTSTEGILFRNSRNECQKFYLSENAIWEEIGGTSTLPLTSTSSMKITSLKFNITGAPQGDGLQPRVTIFIEAETKGGKKIRFQTTISQRDLDVTE